jgi:hypothetical protein
MPERKASPARIVLVIIFALAIIWFYWHGGLE